MFWDPVAMDKCNNMFDYEGLKVTGSTSLKSQIPVPIIGGFLLIQSNIKR
jgi:hypothetical protein